MGKAILGKDTLATCPDIVCFIQKSWQLFRDMKSSNDSQVFLQADDCFLRPWRVEDAEWYVKSRAVKLLCKWAFDSLALERVILKTRPENVRSQRVAKRAGFCRQERTNEDSSDAAYLWFECVPI